MHFDFSSRQAKHNTIGSVKKIGSKYLCRGTSHNRFYPIKPKSQIWEGSFCEKSKSFKKRSKIEKLIFPRVILSFSFFIRKLGVVAYEGELPTTLLPIETKISDLGG